jgi:hypothetical protein
MLTLCNFRFHETSLILLTKSNFIDAVLPIIWQLTPRGLVNWGAALGRYAINHHSGMIRISKPVPRPSYIFISRPSYKIGLRTSDRWTATIHSTSIYVYLHSCRTFFLTDLIIYKLRLLLIPSETTTANRQSTHIVILDACFLTVMGSGR